MQTVKYELEVGREFRRLVVVKDKRTRRVRKLSSAAASMKSPDGSVVENIPISISVEGGAELCLPVDDTYGLTSGEWTFDVVGNFRGYNEPIAAGVINVVPLSTITPVEGAGPLNIRYHQFTDYRKLFDLTDSGGSLIAASDARLQARDSLDAIIMDIGWFASPPDEATIGTLDPNKRGYLSPKEGNTVELHISDQIVLTPGTYNFDLLVQATATQDWHEAASGTITVVDAVTDPLS